MKKESVTKFFSNKFVILFGIFLVLGFATVIATTIGDSGYSGIQLDNYFSGNGNQGIDANVTFTDNNQSNHSLIFEDGLLVNYSLSLREEPPFTFPSSGLVAYYKLDGESGVVEDSYSSYDGTNQGSTRGVEGKINNSFYFNSSETDYVDIPQTVEEKSAITINLWSKSNLSSGWYYDTMISQDGVFNIRIHENGSFEAFLDVNSARKTFYGFNADNDWHMHTLTYDGSVVRYFIDGNQQGGNQSASGDIDSSATYGQNIGRWSSSGFNWEGKIDEVGIWGLALSDSEIEGLYNSGNGLEY